MQQKYQSDNTNKIIVSQDFGGNKYSKNIRVAIQIKSSHRTLEGISTAKISKVWMGSGLQFC